MYSIGPIALVALSVLAVSVCKASEACSVGDAWIQYTAPDKAFSLFYPPTTRPESSQEKLRGLISRTLFKFDRLFGKEPSDEFLKFSLQISVWQNPNRLDGESWAKQQTPSRNVISAERRRIGQFNAWRRVTTNLVWQTVDIFIPDDSQIIELTYIDIPSDGSMITEETARCWVTVFERMVNSMAFGR